MLACARLGIVHSVVFGGFSGEACGLRAADSGSRVLIYADSYYRNGKKIDHKGNADIAVATAKKEGQDIDKVLVWRRYAGHNTSEAPMIMGRDFYVDEVLKDFAGQTIQPVSQDADAPLFLMYTSGTTGKPKGCQHRTGGYLAYVTGTARYYQDIHPEDVYWCMADIGWITGHSYIVYGPLALAATSVLYEGVPQFPDAGRPWRIAERLDVNIFHTSPTAIRMLRKPVRRAKKVQLSFQAHDHCRRAHRAGSLEVVSRSCRQGRSRHRGHLVANRNRRLPHHHKTRARSDETRQRRPCRTRHLSAIWDETRREIKPGEDAAGNLCIRNPWPGIMQTIWGDRSASSNSTTQSTARTRRARNGRTGRTLQGTAPWFPPTATIASSAAWMTSSTSPAIASAPRKSNPPASPAPKSPKLPSFRR